MSLQNEKELFLLLAEGNEQAFTQIFLHYNQRIYPFVLKKVRSHELAEELVQEIFCRLWTHRSYLLDIENPEGYLYRIASNIMLDHFRKQAREYKLMQQLAGSEPLIEEGTKQFSFRETKQILEEGIVQLSSQRKLIYTLRQQGLSYEEIATQMGLTANTVRNHLIAANKFIRKYLTERGIAPVYVLMALAACQP